MEQRTSNIIACCKGNWSRPLPDADPKKRPWANAVAAYMSEECACPVEDYKGPLLEQIMAAALFDYMDGADKPGADLRRLFNWPGMGPEPDMCDRIASVFSLVSVRGEGGEKPVNGFTEKLLAETARTMGLDTKNRPAAQDGVRIHVEAAMLRNAWYAAAAWDDGKSSGPRASRIMGPYPSKAQAIARTALNMARELRSGGAERVSATADCNAVDLETAAQIRKLSETWAEDMPVIAYVPTHGLDGMPDPLAAAAKSTLAAGA